MTGAQSVCSAPRALARRRTAATWALALALTGCTAEQPLPLVARPAPPDELPPLRYRLVCRAAAPEGADVVFVPVPADDRWQTVRSLAVEVAAPGQLVAAPSHVEGAERELEVRSPGGPVLVRALIERPRLDATRLPPPLDQIPRDLAADAWVGQATARGARARIVHGLELRADGTTSARTWPEVVVGGTWTPVARGECGLPPGFVRLSTRAARAEVAGRTVGATVENALHLEE